ncbi:heavy-metal-associated domain-containing protein [Flavobacterium sp. HXWNR69]|uniref:Heavy-metal-associated domain-containing protein n=1 Tax=Flavobacterium fragile TaxID=2949085 RepID=A0ABT0TDW0_9FLAO|nr:heavy-metal-associated domain-containing protein [Flavobacterium sp. HXWNR69]MCL9769074.1 heavy-metal-associated domain-containing protein [Flavobacterium sp. HXWNR69]
MKRIVLLVLACFFTLTMVAQEKKSKNKKVEIEVAGNCGMCEKRIEKAAYSVKGVKNAEWHSDHKTIHLVIDETKCSAEDVAKAIAAAGHDTGSVKALDDVYEKLHGCCLYERMK